MISGSDHSDAPPAPSGTHRVSIKSFCLAGAANLAALAFASAAGALPPARPLPGLEPALSGHGLPVQPVAQSTASAFTVADISGTSGQSIPLSVSIADLAANRLGLLMFRGMPAVLGFTKGFRTGDTWLISLSELENAQLAVPADFQGSFNMDVILVLGEGRQRLTRKVSVNITSKVNAQATDTAVQAPNVTREPPPADMSAAPQGPAVTISAAVEKSLMERAAQFVKNGDVGAARLLYERLATNGSAIGALSMAKTYDPDVLAGLEVVGMKPDVAMARRWYQRAADLGDKSAATRLKTLASSGR